MSDKQVGGTHYQKSIFDPIWLIDQLNLTFIQGNVLKYVYRAKNKNGQEDLAKALSYCEIAKDYSFREITERRKLTLDCDDYDAITDFCKCNDLDSSFKSFIISLYYAFYEDVVLYIKNYQL